MFTTKFIKAAVERAIKTVAQAAVGVLAAGATGVLDVDWVSLGSVSALAGLVSLLTSIAGGAVNGNPSYTSAEKLDAE